MLFNKHRKEKANSLNLSICERQGYTISQLTISAMIKVLLLALLTLGVSGCSASPTVRVQSSASTTQIYQSGRLTQTQSPPNIPSSGGSLNGPTKQTMSILSRQGVLDMGSSIRSLSKLER